MVFKQEDDSIENSSGGHDLDRNGSESESKETGDIPDSEHKPCGSIISLRGSSFIMHESTGRPRYPGRWQTWKPQGTRVIQGLLQGPTSGGLVMVPNQRNFVEYMDDHDHERTGNSYPHIFHDREDENEPGGPDPWRYQALDLLDLSLGTEPAAFTSSAIIEPIEPTANSIVTSSSLTLQNHVTDSGSETGIGDRL